MRAWHHTCVLTPHPIWDTQEALQQVMWAIRASMCKTLRMSACATAMIAQFVPLRAARRCNNAERDVPLVRTAAWASGVRMVRRGGLGYVAIFL